MVSAAGLGKRAQRPGGVDGKMLVRSKYKDTFQMTPQISASFRHVENRKIITDKIMKHLHVPSGTSSFFNASYSSSPRLGPNLSRTLVTCMNNNDQQS
jgi:hypothetical protein